MTMTISNSIFDYSDIIENPPALEITCLCLRDSVVKTVSTQESGKDLGNQLVVHVQHGEGSHLVK